MSIVLSDQPAKVVISGEETAKLISVGTQGPAGIDTLDFDWYVDSVNGSDANDGLSANRAFATLAKLQAQSIAAGDRIGVARGSTWREKLVISENSVTVEAYGPGAAPLFDASDEIDSGDWSKTGGYTNVYEVSLAVETDPLAAEWPSIWVDDTRLARAADLATCDSTPGTYYHGSVADTTPITVYVHAPGSTDPRSDGKTYEAAIRASGIDTDAATGCIIRGVHARRPYCSYGAILLGRYGRVYDCRCSEGNSHNILVRGWTEVYDTVIDDAYSYGSNPVPAVWYESNPTDYPTVRFIRCQVTNSVPSVAFFGHSGGVGEFGTVVIEDCTVVLTAGVAFSSANTVRLEVIRGQATCDDCIKGQASLAAKGVVFFPLTANRLIIIEAANLTVDFEDCIVAVPDSLNMLGLVYSSYAGTKVSMRRCRLDANYAGGRGAINMIRILGAGSRFAAEDNSYGCNSGGTNYDLASDCVLDSDFNVWKQDGTFKVGGATYANRADYVSGTGQDSHSVAG